jgi:tetratricopeptide (TPR) repeat protein
VEITSKSRLLPIEMPDADDQKNALLYSLQTVEAFALYFVVCDPVETRPRLMDELEERIAPQSVERIAVPKETKSLLHFLEKYDFSARPDLLFLYGLENQISGAAHPRSHPLLLNLNTSRNSFEAVVPVPVVFFVPVHVMNAIIQGAPDFFSVRSGTYTFALTADDRESLVQTLNGRDWITVVGIPSEEKEAEIQKGENLLSVYRALPASERVPQDEARLLNSLARLYQAQGQLAEAEILYQQTLETAKNTLPPEHPYIAASLNNLAHLYQMQGRFAEAEPLYQKALETAKNTLSEGHLDVAATLNNLAVLYKEQGRFAEAEPLYQEVLQMHQVGLSEKHPYLAQSLNNLAELYRKQGRIDEAEPLYRKALEIIQNALPQEHLYFAAILNNLAELYREQGRLAEAESLYPQTLEILQKALPSEHPHIAATLNNLALLYHAQDRLDEAETLYKEALRIWQNTLPQGHPNISNGLNNLAGLYQGQGRFAEAKLLYEEALEICLKNLGAEHPDTKTVMKNRERLQEQMANQQNINKKPSLGGKP